MPRKSAASGPQLSVKTLVVDNGANTLKAGFATSDGDEVEKCRIVPNFIARGHDGARGHRIYIADQLDTCTDFRELQFRRPMEKGYIVNWEGELDIWKQAFFSGDAKLYCDPHESNLVMTEAPNCPAALQANCDQVIFEDFEFAAAYRCIGATLNAYNDIPALMGDQISFSAPAECLMVIDSGYSFTTITPLLYGRPLHSAIRRLDVGGKLLSNLLREIVSIRYIRLVDEPHLVNEMKEDACFVSQNFSRDLTAIGRGTAKTTTTSPEATLDPSAQIVQDYVLPDYHTVHRGHLRPHNYSSAARAAHLKSLAGGPTTTAAAAAANVNDDDEDAVPLGSERIAIPELLFTPSDIGIPQAGLAEVVVQSLAALPPGLWPGMLANVVLVGGNAKIEGFAARLETELRARVPADIPLRVRCPDDPLTYTWRGGARMAGDAEALKGLLVTREEYLEYGGGWTARRFAAGRKG